VVESPWTRSRCRMDDVALAAKLTDRGRKKDVALSYQYVTQNGQEHCCEDIEQYVD
jgi:hypothetical protein